MKKNVPLLEIVTVFKGCYEENIQVLNCIRKIMLKRMKLSVGEKIVYTVS